jgi:hypothetical protein
MQSFGLWQTKIEALLNVRRFLSGRRREDFKTCGLPGAVARALFHLADIRPYIIYYGGVGILILSKNINYDSFVYVESGVLMLCLNLTTERALAQILIFF